MALPTLVRALNVVGELIVLTPADTTKPPAVTLTPFLAVTIPSESRLTTSSEIIVPPTVKLPETSRLALTSTVPPNVDTPTTFN